MNEHWFTLEKLLFATNLFLVVSSPYHTRQATLTIDII